MSLIVDSYSESYYNGSWYNLEPERELEGVNITEVAQSFTGNGGYIGSCKFYMKKTGTLTGNVHAHIYAHSGTYGTNSVPTGAAIITSNDIAENDISTSASLVTFTFPTPYWTTAGTKYTVSIDPDKGDTVNHLSVANMYTYENPPSYHHPGNSAQLENSTWVPYARDTIFYVLGYNEESMFGMFW